MAEVVFIKWAFDNNVIEAKVVEVSPTEKKLLLNKNDGLQKPKYCDINHAIRFGIDIKIEQVKSEKKISSYEIEKSEESYEDQNKITEKILKNSQKESKKIIFSKSEIK